MARVALPTDDGLGLAHFGIARTIAVFDVQDGRVVGREDRVNPDPEHRDPAHHAIMLGLVRDCATVIAARMGPPMVRSLGRAGTRVLRAPSDRLEEALEAYLGSERGGPTLPAFSVDEAAPPPGHEPHGHGHGEEDDADEAGHGTGRGEGPRH